MQLGADSAVGRVDSVSKDTATSFKLTMAAEEGTSPSANKASTDTATSSVMVRIIWTYFFFNY